MEKSKIMIFSHACFMLSEMLSKCIVSEIILLET